MAAPGRKGLSVGRRIAVIEEQQAGLGLGLFCYLQRVVDFDPEIPHGTFQLHVTKQ